jgi:hypothetical protein
VGNRVISIFQELAGGYGWVCPYCRAECRYVYGEREKAVGLAIRHSKRCKKRGHRG